MQLSESGSSGRHVPLVRHFELGDGIQLQVTVSKASSGQKNTIDILLRNCSRPLILHWGSIHSGQRNWVLPSDRPSGTRMYKQQALQTPFLKKGEGYSIELELHDSKLEAIEFVLKDEARDKWFKLNHGNFRIDVPKNESCDKFATIPRDLVQQKAYLLWESRGKPNNSPQQEKDMDIFRSITSMDNLSQVLIFLRQEDFENALRELENQLSLGATVDEIKRKMKVGSDNNIADSRKEEGTDKCSTISNSFLPVSYKGHDVSLWLNKCSKRYDGDVNVQSSSFLDVVEQTVGRADIKTRQRFIVGNKEIVVIVKNIHADTHMLVAVNFKGLTLLHWGVSRQSVGEWLVPPPNVVPENSKLLDGACQSYFKSSSQELFQYVDINLNKANFLGVQFVLWSGGSWIKNNGSNFCITLSLEIPEYRQNIADGPEIIKWLLDEISQREKDAERSLMHRFNIATELASRCKHDGRLGLVGILVWLRLVACRHLIWNKNYNVKPREISAAQDKFTDLLQGIYMNRVNDREIVRLIMGCVGRGNHGDVGQCIRDEILVIQRNNHCKNGMMEEWHQKLHNNSSPDDVAICQALLEYVRSNFNMDVYWRTLNNNGLTRSRLASYDRPIVSEPCFQEDAKDGLIRDLTSYLKTLKAVHSGADLDASIANCLGHGLKNQNASHKTHPSFPSRLEENLRYIQVNAKGENVGSLMEKLLESRVELRPLLSSSAGNLKDMIFLDLALDSTLRILMERLFNELRNASLKDYMFFISLMVQNVCLSMDNNEEIVYCTKDWFRACELYKRSDQRWSLQAKAILDRVRLALADMAEYYQQMIQPTAKYLGKSLGVDKRNIDLLTEELIRAGSGATLSLLVNHVDPILRKIANLGSWQVISPAEVCGVITYVPEIKSVQSKVYKRPTIIISSKVTGEEEIPDGVVGVITPDMPDILSHISIRARNSKVFFAACFDEKILHNLRLKEGKEISIQPTSTGVTYIDIHSSGSLHPFSTQLGPKGFFLKKKSFGGKYAISSEEFTSDKVGAKSCNIQHLKGRVPSWIRTPVSIALPFGAFEATLSSNLNKDLEKSILSLRRLINGDDLSKLNIIQDIVQQMRAPSQLVNEMKAVMKMSKILWPGDEGEYRWNQAWTALKKVWASKWNERAVVSCRKAKLNHDDLYMAVLIQEIINADYAFVVHTKNPVSGDFSEIYTEIVKGLGETLVGNYRGRAMSFITKKSDTRSHVITGFPSKQIGMFIKKKSIIFRSDSNGEDLEGYAGAGIYDSITMDKGEIVVLDYSSDRLVCDKSFQNVIFSKIAEAGKIIESVFGSAQDIEGVVKDGEIYIVQARPQL